MVHCCRSRETEKGIVALYVMLFLAFLAGSLGFYQRLATGELALLGSTKRSIEGFYSAESAISMRVSKISRDLASDRFPTGSPPSKENPCEGGNNGTGEMGCLTTPLKSGSAVSYIVPKSAAPEIVQIPAGEKYEGLTARQMQFSVRGIGLNKLGQTSQRLNMDVKLRMVPLFQFGAIFDQDLELYPGPEMELRGPVHTNHNLFVTSESYLGIFGHVTAGERIFNGAKFDSGYSWGGNVWLVRNNQWLWFAGNGPTWEWQAPSLLEDFGTDVQNWVGKVDFPKIGDFEPLGRFWTKSDIRLGLQVNASNVPVGVAVYDASGAVDALATSTLNSSCPTATGFSTGFRDRREGQYMTLLEVDLRQLLECLRRFPGEVFGGKSLGENTDGGLGLYFTVLGPRSSAPDSTYGVRVRNAETLAPLVSGGSDPIGLSIISDQAVYTWGNFNSPPGNDDARIPAAIMADTVHVLSGNWNDSFSDAAFDDASLRRARETVLNAALLAGFKPSGGLSGTDYMNLTPESGGLHNFMRFHEDWQGVSFVYRGSIASISLPRHSTGDFTCCGYTYNAPDRDWSYEDRFLESGKLPPLTPYFSYVKQELFDEDSAA